MKNRDKVYLEQVSKGRNNNLDIMRFIAALMVIGSHSVPISMGAEYSDIISQWTKGRLSFGAIAVGIFFVTGGYLIAGSAERKKTAKDFFQARCLRIFPQLFFVTLIMALAVGMVISELTPAEYYANVNTWKYLLNGIFLLQHDLPGVFTHNIYGNTVNGPLWTLPVEFMCYIMCFAIYKMKLMNKKIFKFTIPIAVLLGIYSGYFAGTFVLTVIRPVLLFYIGIGLYVYRDRVVMSAGTGILSALVFVLLLLLKADVPAMYLCFPYIIYYLAFGLRYKLSGFGKRGEFSYGMYLWGWPAAQVICQMSGGQMSWWLNAILAAVIAVVLGVVNYLVVDRRISRWQKQRIQGK